MVGQLFHGIDSETLLAVPFFLLVGELMASSDVVHRMIRLSQTLVGHLRGGLAQVVTLFSMFFAGISGSSVADVAVLTRTVAPEMDKEGYDRSFTAALIACASTMANLIPPSIMAVVYGATGNVSIGGLFLAGVVPGVLIGIGLMIYSYFWGPVGVMKPRAKFTEVAVAARGAALPLIIPVIIMGGILSGWFTPTEAGMIAVRLHSHRADSGAAADARQGAAARLHVRRPALFAAAGRRSRAPRRSAGWSRTCAAPTSWPTTSPAFAGTDGRMIMLLLVVLFVIVGDFIDAVPAIIIFMPIILKLTEVGHINPLHMGVVIITTLVFGLITPPYGLSLLVASKYVGVGFGKALVRSLPLYIVFFLTIGFCVFFPDVVLWLPKMLLPESVGCFKVADRSRLHLSAIGT